MRAAGAPILRDTSTGLLSPAMLQSSLSSWHVRSAMSLSDVEPWAAPLP